MLIDIVSGFLKLFNPLIHCPFVLLFHYPVSFNRPFTLLECICFKMKHHGVMVCHEPIVENIYRLLMAVIYKVL